MGQKINIPSQNQPFRKQSSLGGDVSFRNLNGTNDNSFITLAKVTKVYYKQGKLDFKLTNTVSIVQEQGGDGSGSAPIPVDFFGRKPDGQVFGHYRPVKVGDLIAIAYINGHRSNPIVIGVYPDSAPDYELISPSMFETGDDNDSGIAETGLAEQKVYPSMQTSYRSGSGTIAEALNGHSFLILDDETANQYDQLWTDYESVGFFNHDGETTNPLKEEAGSWLLVHEDNPDGNGDDHRTRFYVNPKGEIQIVLMGSDSEGDVSVLEGSRRDGFTLKHYNDLSSIKAGDKGQDVYNPDFDVAKKYVELNIGKDQSILMQAVDQGFSGDNTSLTVKPDGVYLNDKPLDASITDAVRDHSKEVANAISKDLTTTKEWEDFDNRVIQAGKDAKDAGDKAKQAGEDAKQAGISAEKAGEDAKKTGEDIKRHIIYYASAFPQGDHYIPGKYLAINTETYIANGIIKSAMIEDGAIDNAKIAYEAVGSSQIEDLAVTRGKLAYMAVGTAQIEDLAVSDEKVDHLSFNHMEGELLDAHKIRVRNLSGDSISAKTLTADKLIIGELGDITDKLGTIADGKIIVKGNGSNSGVSLEGLDADNPDVYTPSKKAILANIVKAIRSSALASLDYAKQVGLSNDPVAKDLQNKYDAMVDGLAPIFNDMSVSTNFDHNTVEQLTSDCNNAIDKFQNLANSQLNRKIGQTADNKNSVYQGYEQPANPHINDIWFQENSDGTYQIRVYDGGSWISPGMKDIKDVQESVSTLPRSYYSSTQPAGTDYKDGDIWYKTSTDTTNNTVVYTAYKWNRNTNTWDPLLDATSSHNYIGSAPANPIDGDFWMDNTTLKQYQNGVWKTIPTQGPQGVPGVSAKQQYTHIAYSTSANGTENFSSSTFSGATYIGLLVDFNEEDSSDPTKYAWSLMKGADGTDGKDGVPGKPGADGKTSYVHFAYANSSDGKTGFNLVYFNGAKYIGIYSDFTEADSDDYTKYTWSEFRGQDGQDGTNGKDGVPGTNGKDGETSYIHTAYANSSDGKTNFSLKYFTNALYIGMYTDFTEADSDDYTKYTWSRLKGADGTDGKDGVPGKPGADGKTSYVHFAYANSSDGNTNFNLEYFANALYIGTYTDFNEEDSKDHTKYTWSRLKGDPGANGKDGVAGKDGVGLKRTEITYGLSESDSTQPSRWSSQVPDLVKGQYLWSKTVWTYTDDTSETGYQKTYIAKDGNDGTDGVAGKDGVGISSTTITYAVGTSGTTAPTSGWDSQVPNVPTGQYLWTKTVWRYTDNTNETGYSVAKMGEPGPKGDPGKDGVPGTNGKDGKTYYTWIKYATDSSGSNISDSPTGMSYIGIAYNKESQTESSTPTDYTWTKIKGDDGIPGKPGADGKTSYFHVAYANSSDGRDGFTTSPNISSSYRYLGTYTDYTSTSSRNPSSYTWVPMFDSTKKRNFTSQPTTPYAVGDTWTQSGATYFCTTARDSGAFSASDWTMQQLTIQSLAPSVANSLYNDNLVSGTDQEYIMGYGIPNTVWQDGYAYLKLPTNAASNEILPQEPHTFSYTLDRGTTYTQTIWFETDATVKDLSVAQITWFTSVGHDPQPATLINLGENKYKLYSTYMWPGKSGNNVRLFDIFNLKFAFDLSTGTYLKFGKLKLEKGSVATPWCLSQSELTTTTRDYRGVTLNDRGLTATAGSTTVAMNSTDGFLINNASGQVFHVDTNGNLNMKGDLVAGNISGVNFTGQSLNLAGSLKVSGSILSSNGNVAISSNGLTIKDGGLRIVNGNNETTTMIRDDGTFATNKGYFSGEVHTTKLILSGNNSDINMGGLFHVDSQGNVTATSIRITGNRKDDVSKLATIEGANITGNNLIQGNVIQGNTITGNTITGGTINGSVFNTLNGQNKISNLSRPYFSDVGSKSFRISKSGLLTAENSVLKVFSNHSAYTFTIGDKKGTFSNYIGYSGSEKNLTTDFYRYGVGQQESPSSQGVVGYYYYGNDNVPDGRADPKGTVILPVAWIKNNPGVGYMYLQYYLGVDASNVVNGNFRMVAFSPNYKNFSFSNDKTTGLDYLSSFNYDRFNFSNTDISGKYIRSNNFHIPTGMDTLYMDEFDLSSFPIDSDICFGVAIYPEQVADRTHPWAVAFTLESFSWGSKSGGDITLNVDESHGSNVSSQSLNISNNGALSIEYVGDSSGGTNVDYSYINMNKGVIDLTASQPGYGTWKTMKTTISGTGIDFNTFNVSDPNDVYPITFRGTVTNTGGQTGIQFDGYGNIHAQVGAGIWRIYNNQGDEVFNVPFDPNGVFNFYVPRVNKNTRSEHKWGGLKIGWVYFDQPQYNWAETVPAIYNTGGRVKGFAMFDQYLISFVDGWCYQLSSWWNHGVPNGVDSSRGEAQGTNTDAGHRDV